MRKLFSDKALITDDSFINYCRKRSLLFRSGILILLLTVFGQSFRVDSPSARKVVLENGKVRAIIEIGNGRLLKEKYYTLSANGQWTLVLSQFTPFYTPKDTADTQLWNTDLNPHRFLVQKMKVNSLTKKKDGDVQKAVIELKQGNNLFTQEIWLKPGESFFHVEVMGRLKEDHPDLDYMLSAYTFHYKGVPEFVHTPGLKFDDPRSGKGRDQVLGDRAFHSPAVVLQQQSLFAAMIPDLKMANEKSVLTQNARQSVLFTPNPAFVLPVPKDYLTMPVGIDLNVNTGISDLPVLTYGLMDAQVGYHTRFMRAERDSKMVRKLYGNNISYGFDLLVNAVAANEPGYPIASKHLWKYYGEPVFNSEPHLAMPYANYLRQVRDKVFFPIRDEDGELYKIPGGFIDPPLEGYEDHGSWLEWNVNNEKVGGFRCSAPFWTDVINNSVFWNQARDAVGMYYWGQDLKDSLLISKARMIVNFCLNAPRNEQGLFATVFSAKDKTWGIGWSDPPHGKNVLFLRDAKSYEIPALCKTGAHLLDYYTRAEKDERIIKYLTPFANWLLTVIDDRGIIPSYVTENMKLSPILYESAQPAAGMWFLAEMYNVTKQQKYLDGAKKIGAYISKEIIPTAKWSDMEQYVSCGQKPFTMVKDEWQGQWFRGNLCIAWACEGFASLHKATGDTEWLKSGEKCIDYLSFTQACWSPDFVYTANPFGGFGTDNGDDAALMDQRQADFVKTYLYYGLKLNRSDLLERGVAAGQAACVLIHNKRHIANGITTTPVYYPEGLASENIDHEGISQWPMRTHPLWGEGIAVFTGLSEIRRQLGGLYIDLDNDIVVGTDGVKILSDSLNSDGTRKIDVESFMSGAYLKLPYEKDYNIDVVVTGNDRKLVLNGKQTGSGSSTLTIPAKN